MVAQHNALMLVRGLTFLGLIGAPSWRTAEKRAIDLARLWLDRIGLIDRADEPPATCPMATSAGSKSRARCAPNRHCCAWTNRPPGSTRVKVRH